MTISNHLHVSALQKNSYKTGYQSYHKKYQLIVKLGISELEEFGQSWGMKFQLSKKTFFIEETMTVFSKKALIEDTNSLVTIIINNSKNKNNK